MASRSARIIKELPEDLAQTLMAGRPESTDEHLNAVHSQLGTVASRTRNASSTNMVNKVRFQLSV